MHGVIWILGCNGMYLVWNRKHETEEWKESGMEGKEMEGKENDMIHMETTYLDFDIGRWFLIL